MLIGLGLGLILPRLGLLIERPFAKLAAKGTTGTKSGFVLGLALGAVFVPCAGPVLAAIVVLGASHRVGLLGVLITLFFAAGASTPLLGLALAGEKMVERNTKLKARAKSLRPIAGALLIVMAVALSFNLANWLQVRVPGYTASLQRLIEGNHYTLSHLKTLEHEKIVDGQLANCTPGAANLNECGTAPNFTGITAWLNTPGDRPLTMQGLRGKVVLIDFWTYSCINCQRTLPHVEAWNRLYNKDGLVIVGVESPEFAFEHVVSNIKAAAAMLGVDYPIAVDDNLATWSAYNNEYWPAEYLIDASGVVRHVDFGEGQYPQTESLIRTLLKQANPTVQLPPPSSVPNVTPTEATSPETYLGDYRAQYYANSNFSSGTINYTMPKAQLGEYGLGGTWDVGSEYQTSGPKAALDLNFEAKDVYLVLGGTGTLSADVAGATKNITVSGVPRLYTLASFKNSFTGVMKLHFSPGIKAYDFTFG
jgi:thiol-disulfide isomerase/thioredoxin